MAAHVVPEAGVLDLDDVGPEVAQDLTTQRSGQDRGHVENANARKRHRHEKSPTISVCTSGQAQLHRARDVLGPRVRGVSWSLPANGRYRYSDGGDARR